MSGEVDRDDSLLTNDERAIGFSIVVDQHDNTRLLIWGNTVASFSSTVASTEVIRGFLELIKVPRVKIE